MSARTIEERFYGHIRKEVDGCWIWTSTANKKGYGQFYVQNRTELAHRFSWKLHRGSPGRLFVLHKCDIPLCVNPDHLFLGTQADNVADMDKKGRRRHPTGRDHYMFGNPGLIACERNPNARLTPNDVREMRRVYAAGGVSTPQLARTFNISKSQAHKIVSRQAWALLP